MKIKTYYGTVYSWECDHMGHMNVKFYVEKFDHAVWHLFSSIGLTGDYFRKNERGMVALEQQLKYYKELLPGDTIYVESEIMETLDKVIKLKSLMYKSDTNELVAETTITGLHIDTKRRKGQSLPQFVPRHG